MDSYPTRYDPCVVPPSSASASATPHTNGANGKGDDSYALFSTPDPIYYSSADYVQAYKSHRTTPISVSEYLLSLIRSPPHSTAFIEINDELTLSLAKASTERYASGKELGPLDGVPIAIKDEVDLKGFRRTYGSAKVFMSEECETSWAVKKLLEAGAVVIGKANMHELGTGEYSNI